MTHTYGVDVSHWQGDIDWQALYSQGVRFAFVKATQADWQDDRFTAHWKAAKAAGMLRGAYHYMTWDVSAINQARAFLAAIAQDPGELPPVCDYELRYGASGASVMSAMLRGWLSYVEGATGKQPIIYTGISFWQQYGTKADWVLRHPLWLAFYALEPQPSSFPPPSYLRASADAYTPQPWGSGKWAFWQYSDRGWLTGSPDRIDLDVFNGSEAELRRRFGLADGGAVDVPDDALARLWAAHPELWG